MTVRERQALERNRPVRTFIAGIVAGGLTFNPGPAAAWGDRGHEIVALIARAYLTPGVKQQVDALLKSDPSPLTPPGMAAAATWSDKYRDKDIDGARQRTRFWHYVDIEITKPDLEQACFGPMPPPTGLPASMGRDKDCIVYKIQEFEAELANPATDPREQVIALKFLLHLVGDIHQPLHAANDRDRGGNDKRVSTDRLYANTLHHYWDVEFVQELGTDAAKTAAGLMQGITSRDRALWAAGTPADWAFESFQIARDRIYARLPRPNEKGSYKLSEADTALAAKDAAGQLSKAGVRLAMVLNRALGQRR
jgi:hypothetical protein